MLVSAFALLPFGAIAIAMIWESDARYIPEDLRQLGVVGAIFSIPVSLIWLLVCRIRKRPAKESVAMLRAAFIAFVTILLFGTIGRRL